MGPVGGRGFGGSVKFADGKTSSANVPHLNVWGFDISAAEFPQQKKTPIHTKDVRFFCCGNSAADKGLFIPKTCVFFCCGNSAAKTPYIKAQNTLRPRDR